MRCGRVSGCDAIDVGECCVTPGLFGDERVEAGQGEPDWTRPTAVITPLSSAVCCIDSSVEPRCGPFGRRQRGSLRAVRAEACGDRRKVLLLQRAGRLHRPRNNRSATRWSRCGVLPGHARAGPGPALSTLSRMKSYRSSPRVKPSRVGISAQHDPHVVQRLRAQVVWPPQLDVRHVQFQGYRRRGCRHHRRNADFLLGPQFRRGSRWSP